MSDRFEKFTERARKVLTLAQEEAQRLQHNYIGTEHLLLGLVRENDGVAARVLANLGVDIKKVRDAVNHVVGRGERLPEGEIGLTPRAKKVIELAVDEARRLNHHYIGTEHILLGLLREGEGLAAGVLISLGVSLESLRQQVIQVLNQSTYSNQADVPVDVPMGWQTLRGISPAILRNAIHELQQLVSAAESELGKVAESKTAELGNLLNGLKARISKLRELLSDPASYQTRFSTASPESPNPEGVQQGNMAYIPMQRTAPNFAERVRSMEQESEQLSPKPTNKSLLELAKAGKLDPLIGRERELARLLHILNRRDHPHAILIGESGVGKSALVRGLAQYAADNALEVDEVAWMRQTDFADFIMNPGRIMKQFDLEGKPIILAVAQFERLVEFAAANYRLSTIYDLLKHPIYRLVAATTPLGYQKIKDIEPTLANHFQPVNLAELDEADTVQVLRGLKLSYEQFHEVWIDDSALEMAVLLSEKYLPDKYQPGKALDLLDEACSMVALRRETEVIPKIKTENLDEEAAVEEALIQSPVTAYEVTEVVATLLGKTVEQVETELDEE